MSELLFGNTMTSIRQQISYPQPTSLHFNQSVVNYSPATFDEIYQVPLQGDSELATEASLNAFVRAETMIVVGDLQGVLLQVNSKFCAVTQFSETELLAHGLRFYSPAGNSSLCIQDLCPRHRERNSWHGEFFVISRNNEIRWFESKIMLCRDVHGEAFQYIAIHHEMTAKKAAELALSISRDQLRELNATQHKQVDNERQRFAREIHDELGQYLLALKNELSFLDQEISVLLPQLQSQSLNAIRLVDMAILSIRSIINDIRPPILQLGIVAALEWQVARFQQSTGVACAFMRTVEDVEMPADKTMTLFRVLQEALVNVQKHANARNVQVIVEVRSNEFQLNVIDDGVGLSPDYRHKHQSFGILGMQERVLAHDGLLSIRDIAHSSSSNFPFKSGTSLLAIIPI
jgi:PAS domain S-box-containing protein